MNLLRPIALLGVLLAASCASAPVQRVVFADDLRGEVEIDRPTLRRTEQNLLKVTQPIRNVAGEDLRLLVQVQFLDELGAPSGDQTNRQQLVLPRGAVEGFTVTSRTSNARDYKMYLWRADR